MQRGHLSPDRYKEYCRALRSVLVLAEQEYYFLRGNYLLRFEVEHILCDLIL